MRPWRAVNRLGSYTRTTRPIFPEPALSQSNRVLVAPAVSAPAHQCSTYRLRAQSHDFGLELANTYSDRAEPGTRTKTGNCSAENKMMIMMMMMTIVIIIIIAREGDHCECTAT